MASALKRAVTLVELLVVLAIIGALLALLFPAVQGARHQARLGVCKNHIRQIDIAVRSCWSAQQKPPDPLSDWPVAILPWIEEQPLADRMKSTPRDVWSPEAWPLLLRCPFQPEEAGDQRHYAWIVTSPPKPGDDWPFPTFRDTERIDPAAPARPWFDGAVLLVNEARLINDNGRGPHPGGTVHEARNGGETSIVAP